MGKDTKILSLLPSATEICYLLGLEDNLVGVTHECNWPKEAEAKPKVTGSVIPKGATPLEIDDIIRQAAKTNTLTQQIDLDKIRQLEPDIILTQDICKVCAVPKGHLTLALEVLNIEAEIISLDPYSLDDVLQNILTVGSATGRESQAAALVTSFRSTLEDLRNKDFPSPPPNMFALEWANPPYSAGHWIPEMIEIAGAYPVCSVKNGNSTRLDWDMIAGLEFDSVLFMPCGFQMEEVLSQAKEILNHPALAGAEKFYAANAGGHFSRPGPRLIEGTVALSEVLRTGVSDDSIIRRIK